MKIIVFIKSVPDTKVPLECGADTLTLKQEWNVSMLNPDDEAAIAAVLKIKQENPGTRITVVHWGPPSGERFIRDAMVPGCDDGLRLWEEDLNDIGTQGKALIFSRVARILGFDLIVTGTGSLDTATGQMGVLLGSLLQVPCITRVTGIDVIRPNSIEATRELDQGYQQRVASARPLVITMEAGADLSMQASFPAVVQAYEREIPCLDLARIGIPHQAVRKADSHFVYGNLRFPAPKLQSAQPFDSSLPAFERRRQLDRSSADIREGNVVKRDGDSAAEEIFRILLRAGWLDHLRSKNPEE